MGFQLGPKLLRKAPKGWLSARAFPVKLNVYEHPQGPEGGETVFETSAGLTVTWRVEVEGRQPYEEHVPAWEREARVRRAIAKHDGAFYHTVERIINPFAGKLRAGEQEFVDRALARRPRAPERVVLMSETQQAAINFGPVPREEMAEQRRRMDELARIQQTHATRDKVGKRVDAWVDPSDPEAICPG